MNDLHLQQLVTMGVHAAAHEAERPVDDATGISYYRGQVAAYGISIALAVANESSWWPDLSPRICEWLRANRLACAVDPIVPAVTIRDLRRVISLTIAGQKRAAVLDASTLDQVAG